MSAARAWVSSFRRETIRCCQRTPISLWTLVVTVSHSGRIAKLSSMEATRMTTLQREILYFVLIIASLATAVAILIVILWAAW